MFIKVVERKLKNFSFDVANGRLKGQALCTNSFNKIVKKMATITALFTKKIW